MKYLKFYAVKLFILLINAVCSSLLSYMFALTLTTDYEASMTSTVFYYLIPMLFFFCFTFTLARNIKAPAEEAMHSLEYFAKFGLREASVYIIFLLPLLICGLCGAGLSGIIDYLYRPHSFLLRFMSGAFGVILNFISVSLIFAVVSSAAHFMTGIKARKAASKPANQDNSESFYAADGDDYEDYGDDYESESDDDSDNDDTSTESYDCDGEDEEKDE